MHFIRSARSRCSEVASFADFTVMHSTWTCGEGNRTELEATLGSEVSPPTYKQFFGKSQRKLQQHAAREPGKRLNIATTVARGKAPLGPRPSKTDLLKGYWGHFGKHSVCIYIATHDCGP